MCPKGIASSNLAGANMNVPIILSGPTGPYEHGYLMCRVQYSDGEIKMITYQKYVYESKFGKLPEGYVVHHKDENKNNYDINNLEVKSNSQHAKEHGQKGGELKIKFVCPMCKRPAEKNFNDVEANRKKGKDGPFCSRTCGSRYGRLKQLGRV